MDDEDRGSMLAIIAKEFAARREKERVGDIRHSVGWPLYDERELWAALDCLLDLRLSQGPKVFEFERKYAEYIGLESGGAVAVNSGSSANLVAFAALMQAGRLQVGDEVVVPAATFATVSSVLYQLGLVPVYVDSEMDTWNMDPEALGAAIGSKTKAVMVVHNLGIPAKMDEIMAIAKDRSLLVIEDCCEAHGSFYKGRQVGSIGHMATLSFFVAHNITTGEGGMVFYKDNVLKKPLKQMREFGRSIDPAARYESTPELGEYDTRYIFEALGFNVRMTDFAAAMGIIQLEKLEELNSIRRNNARKLDEIIGNFGGSLKSHVIGEDIVPGYYGFPIYVSESAHFKRNDICRHLEAFGIETRPNMGGCLPDQPGFVGRAHRIHGSLKNARKIRDNAFFIGVHSGLEGSHFENFSTALSSFFETV